MRMRIALPALVLALGACQSVVVGLGTRTVALDEPFTLAIDDDVTLAGADLWVRFRDVSHDSRCPVDVSCVWQGDAEVILGVGRDARERLRALHTTPGVQTGPRSTSVDGYRITLLELEPLPRSGRRIPRGEYRATLRITRDL